METEPQWRTCEIEYEGFPLFLRWPDGLDYAAVELRHPKLLVLTHKFSFRKFNGLPEPKYNHTLMDFDLTAVALFRNTAQGQILLVETFGGERNYYYAVSDGVDSEQVTARLRSRFAGLVLEGTLAKTSPARFMGRYMDDNLAGV